VIARIATREGPAPIAAFYGDKSTEVLLDFATRMQAVAGFGPARNVLFGILFEMAADPPHTATFFANLEAVDCFFRFLFERHLTGPVLAVFVRGLSSLAPAEHCQVASAGCVPVGCLRNLRGSRPLRACGGPDCGGPRDRAG
jgi:hypothetical protein